jgi:tetratricopeptide (TPR) repeat protein
MEQSVYEGTYQRLIQQKAYDNGIELFSSIIAQIPGDAEGYIYRAQFYERKWQIEDALNDITKALEIAPEDGYAHYIHGNIRRRMLDFRGAIAAYSHAISAGYTAAYNNRGVMLMRLKKYRAARGDFTLALQHNPELVRAYHNRGLVRCHLKDYEGAIRDLTIASTKDPQYHRSYMVLGCAYYTLGKQEQARNALCHYVKRSGDLNPEVRTLLIQLGGCRDSSMMLVSNVAPQPPLDTNSQKPMKLPDTKPLTPFVEPTA